MARQSGLGFLGARKIVDHYIAPASIPQGPATLHMSGSSTTQRSPTGSPSTHCEHEHMAMRRGDFVEFSGLRRQTEVNGKIGIVKDWIESKQRYAVQPARGSRILLAKVDNLVPSACGINACDLDAIGFWPAVALGGEESARVLDMPVMTMDDWPPAIYYEDGWPADDYADKRDYLQERFSWSEPKCLGGVTSRGQAKPDFVMYYDADDVISPVNMTAERIAALMPSWEHGKVPAPPSGYRGLCILEYAPTIRQTFGSAGVFPRCAHPTRSLRTRFTLAELRAVLLYQTTKEAQEMYARHMDPEHCMCGGL